MPPILRQALAERPDSGAEPPSQTVRAQLLLRELILGGELAPGARIAELALVERLGASRTPVRSALARLEEEGLVESLPSGGYVVRAFTEADIHDAVEIRGTLEGLAARMAAERGVSALPMAQARACVAEIDALLAEPVLAAPAFAGYVECNRRFHALLVDLAGSETLRREIERAVRLPFASPNAFVMASSVGPRARDVLVVAQEQHRLVLDAIEAREGVRAEALMREHARIARRNLQAALTDRESLSRVPGARLIRGLQSRESTR